MNILFSNLIYLGAIVFSIQLIAKTSLRLKDSLTSISREWHQEIHARHCAEAEAFSRNILDAAVILKNQRKRSTAKINRTVSEILSKIESKSHISNCQWSTGDGRSYVAIPHQQKSSVANAKALPNWVVAIRNLSN